MASSCGTSSGSSLMQTSGSEEAMVDQRKRKRMISNRESAKRSRMRKQKHLDDLTAQVSVLRKKNDQIVTAINEITQNFLNMNGENSIHRAQVDDLSHRLSSLNAIISFLTPNNGGINGRNENHSSSFTDAIGGCFKPPSALNQPITADTFLYYIPSGWREKVRGERINTILLGLVSLMDCLVMGSIDEDIVRLLHKRLSHYSLCYLWLSPNSQTQPGLRSENQT